VPSCCCCCCCCVLFRLLPNRRRSCDATVCDDARRAECNRSPDRFLAVRLGIVVCAERRDARQSVAYLGRRDKLRQHDQRHQHQRSALQIRIGWLVQRSRHAARFGCERSAVPHADAESNAVQHVERNDGTTTSRRQCWQFGLSPVFLATDHLTDYHITVRRRNGIMRPTRTKKSLQSIKMIFAFKVS
jgi:hypothetical protein